jgi:hypothetical protein
MSPVSRSRKPKRPAHHPVRTAPASPFAPLLADAAELVTQTDPLVAEMWASSVLGILFVSAWNQAAEEAEDHDHDHGDDHVHDAVDPDELFEANVNALFDYLASQRKPAALAALRALGAVGEEWTRGEALDAAEALAERGVKEPAWLTNAVEPEPSGIVAVGDEFGERHLISLAFTRGTETHVLTAQIVHTMAPDLITLSLHNGFDEEEMRAGYIESTGLEPVDLDLAEARIRLEDALEILLCHEPVDLPEDLGDEADLGFSDPKQLWPLLAVRLELLPQDDEAEDRVYDNATLDPAAQVQAAVEAFLASPRAAELPDREFAGQFATVLADEAVVSERGPYSFGPLGLAVCLEGETVSHLAFTDQQLDQVGPVATAWAHFTTDARNLSAAAHEAWDEQLPELTEAFRELYLHPESVAHRAECPDVIPVEKFEPGATPTEEDLAENLARLLAEATGSSVEPDTD